MINHQRLLRKTSTGYFEFPTKEDWKRIYNASAFNKIYSMLDGLEDKEHTTLCFTQNIELSGWLYELRQGIGDIAISYCFMMFYYEKGIPDGRPYISPGTNGESIQYCPDSEPIHFHIKAWFDFFSDTLYYKLFSAWDVIGHILNLKYDLKIDIDKVYFGTAIGKLRKKDINLHACLNNVLCSSAYKTAHKNRVNITHNYLPSTAHMIARRDNNPELKGNVTHIDIKEYVKSEEIVTNVQEALELFAATLRYVLK